MEADRVRRQEGEVRLNWLNEGLQLKLRIHPAGLALAALYAIACWGARQLSFDQFYLPAGIRVAALLLCPPRLWPYLLLGEYAYFAQIRYPLIEKYGIAWVILASTLLMPAVMLIVHRSKQLMSRSTNAGLLVIAAAASVVVTLTNLGLSHALWPSPPSDTLTAFLTRAGRFTTGDFLGILTVAPLALVWAARHAEPTLKREYLGTTTLAVVSMIVLGIMAAWMPDESAAARTSIQLLLALPAVVLTGLHGWKGAAVGVPLLNLMIGLSMPKPYPATFDATVLATQQVMAITGIALLLLGARISQYHRRYRQRESSEKKAISLARSSHVASEMELRERAISLRRLGDGIDLSLTEVVNWLTSQGHQSIANSLLHTATVHSRLVREQASMVYPTALEQLGLYVALQAGGVRAAWNGTHRVVDPRLSGDPCNLSLDLQLLAYRTLIDAVSLMLKHETGQIVVRTRCVRGRGQRGIVMTVALLDPHRALSSDTGELAADRLAGRMLAFGGTVRTRHNRIRMLLVEPSSERSSVPGHGPAGLQSASPSAWSQTRA